MVLPKGNSTHFIINIRIELEPDNVLAQLDSFQTYNMDHIIRDIELRRLNGKIIATTKAKLMDGEYYLNQDGISPVRGYYNYNSFSSEYNRVVGAEGHNTLPGILPTLINNYHLLGTKDYKLKFNIAENGMEVPETIFLGFLKLIPLGESEDNFGTIVHQLVERRINAKTTRTQMYTEDELKALVKKAAYEDNTIIILDGIEEWFKNNLK